MREVIRCIADVAAIHVTVLRAEAGISKAREDIVVRINTLFVLLNRTYVTCRPGVAELTNVGSQCQATLPFRVAKLTDEIVGLDNTAVKLEAVRQFQRPVHCELCAEVHGLAKHLCRPVEAHVQVDAACFLLIAVNEAFVDQRHRVVRRIAVDA